MKHTIQDIILHGILFSYVTSVKILQAGCNAFFLYALSDISAAHPNADNKKDAEPRGKFLPPEF